MSRVTTNVKNVKGKFTLTPATTIEVNKKYVHNSYGVVEVLDMSIHGDWNVKVWDGQVIAVEEEDLHDIYFVSITKNNVISPLKNTQYNQVFSKGYIESQGIVDCVLNSPIFDISSKSYSKTCINCDAWFDAAKKQLYCETCNDFRHYVTVDKKNKVKTQTKRIDYHTLNDILVEVYLEGSKFGALQSKTSNAFDLSAYVYEKFNKL